MIVPAEIRTTRLLLRPWCAADAAELLPILETNLPHLGPWIPARVAQPAPVPDLAQRLAGFAADFVADREWRFALRTVDDGRILGEVALFSRTAAGRVPYADADRAEVGYWLRADVTGRGLATDATRAMIDLAAGLSRFSHVEIRCDARNAASAAVPTRLGFVLATTVPDPDTQLQIWTLALAQSSMPRTTMPLLFSYGTLQNDDVQLSTFGRRLAGEPDELVGFESAVFRVDDPRFVAASGKADHAIVRFNGRSDSRVHGTVFEVSESELARADRYEPAGYRRIAATLASGRKAWVYADISVSEQP